mmetsp:Transcript_19861/g.76106  ORF Transcript_19861/g.76106 Transcript_19861/m.76106 type:complete len:280 (-) Transcript_19861:324-1163(-)
MQPPRRRAARSSPGCASSWQSRDVSNASTQRSRRPQASPECARIPERHFSRPSPRPGPRPARAQGRQGPPAPAPRPPLASPPPAHSPGSTTVSTRRMAPSGEPALTCWAVLNDSAASRFHSSPALTYERPSRYQVSESSLLTSVMFSKICTARSVWPVSNMSLAEVFCTWNDGHFASSSRSFHKSWLLIRLATASSSFCWTSSSCACTSSTCGSAGSICIASPRMATHSASAFSSKQRSVMNSSAVEERPTASCLRRDSAASDAAWPAASAFCRSLRMS